MKVAVTGATGFIGSALCNELSKEHNVIALTRRPEKASILFERPIEIIKWNPSCLDGWEKCLEDTDAIVNLAGVSIAAGRWTEKRKDQILNSRINSYSILIEAIRKTKAMPRTFLISSAIGFYGSRGDEHLYEESDNGNGFLAGVCREIEKTAKELEKLDIRTVVMRTGIVLGTNGGAFPKMALPFRFFLGGNFGSGKQWMSWISLEDEISAIRFLLEDHNLKGVFNLTSGHPQRNHEFCRALAESLNKPCWLPAPSICLKIVLGQMADELLLTSQRVYPRKLLTAGFKFKNPDLRNTLLAMQQTK